MDKDEKIARELTEKFVTDIAKQLGIDLLYSFFGSLARGKYVHGKSDIDLLIVPKKCPHHGELTPTKFLCMNEHGKKYGTVFKKGRTIGIFDIMIFMNCGQQKQLRDILLTNKDTTYETNLFKNDKEKT